MFKIPINELKQKIVQSGKITEDSLDEKIKNKINELSGLISEEGAAHIIANELGIVIVPAEGERLKINKIYVGMRGVEALGKVVRVFGLREFQKGDSTGKVASIVIGDESGTIRVVGWGEKAEVVGGLNEGDTILIKSGYVKENRDQKEVHLNDKSQVDVNPAGEVVEGVRQGPSYDRKKISELGIDEEGELMTTVVQVFDPRFFTVCPECNKRVQERDGGFHCHEHNEVKPVVSYVLNLVLDDGSGTIRAVFWKSQIESLLGKSEAEVASFKDNLAAFEDIKTDLLGEQFKLLGKAKKNDMFDRLEFNVQRVFKADAEEEIKKVEENN
ncbi:hypothetical protein HOC13_02955 [Candidatus Woesearchaeota archaeon]|jgi:ssDNA-binding replication factor A large subunit|nr:hypothetical protein [Candidatus Woesearchaeota archaeon]